MAIFPASVAPESSHKSGGLLKDASRFPNLRAAGRRLASKLEIHREDSESLVLGIVLGGVPVAHEVATHLSAPLDLVIIRRLLAAGPGSQICAVNVGGSMVIDKELKPPEIPSTPLDHFLTDAIAELDRREHICRRGRPPIEIAGRNVILVDCGIHTGSTMKAAIGALRTMEPKQIVAAVPVASPEGFALVAGLADKMVCLAQPESFGHAGLWYEDFSRPEDDRVGELLS